MKLIIPKNVTWKNLEKGVVVLNIEKGTYYALNETATRIWNFLVQGKDIHFVEADMIEAFDVDESALKKDIAETLAYLREEALLVESEASASDPKG